LVTCRYALPYLENARLLTDVGRWLKPAGVFYALIRVSAEDDPTGASGSTDERPDPLGPFHCALSQKQVGALGTGWVSRTTYQLSRRSWALVLRDYE
jgi:hypothetical protein